MTFNKGMFVVIGLVCLTGCDRSPITQLSQPSPKEYVLQPEHTWYQRTCEGCGCAWNADTPEQIITCPKCQSGFEYRD